MSGVTDVREMLGRKVREAWVAYCLETGDTKPSHIASWDELSEWDKEADRRIGEAVIDWSARDGLSRVAEERDKYKAWRHDISQQRDAATAALARVEAVIATLPGERPQPPHLGNIDRSRLIDLTNKVSEYGSKYAKYQVRRQIEAAIKGDSSDATE